MSIVDVEVLDGGWLAEEPVVILDAATAHKAIQAGAGELEAIVQSGLDALGLSGKRVVFLKEEKIA